MLLRINFRGRKGFDGNDGYCGASRLGVCVKKLHLKLNADECSYDYEECVAA